MKKLIFLGLMLTILFGFSQFSIAQDESKSPNTPGIKIYTVYSGDSTPNWNTISNLETVEFNGIKCLKGQEVPTKNKSWMENKVVYIPIDKITMIVEFNSLEDFKGTPNKDSKNK